jgi:hypothetical protein
VSIDVHNDSVAPSWDGFVVQLERGQFLLALGATEYITAILCIESTEHRHGICALQVLTNRRDLAWFSCPMNETIHRSSIPKDCYVRSIGGTAMSCIGQQYTGTYVTSVVLGYDKLEQKNQSTLPTDALVVCDDTPILQTSVLKWFVSRWLLPWGASTHNEVQMEDH